MGTSYIDPIHADPQNPVQVNSDSVYENDIDLSRCVSTGWTGNVLSMFNNLFEEIYNDSATSPKILTVYFYRTVYSDSIGIGCNSGKTFSNTKIELIGSGGTVRQTINESTSNTTYTSRVFQFPPQAFNEVKIYFYTTAAVGITNLTIRKESVVAAVLKATKPDGTTTYIDATTGGNLKVSIEEAETGVNIGLTDHYGFEVENTPMGEQRTAIPHRLVGSTFIGNTLDTNFYTETPHNAGTATIANSQLTLSTGTSAGGGIEVQSVRTARYIGGNANRFRAVIRHPDTGQTGNTRKWGAFSSSDGTYFKLVGSALSVCTYKGSAEISVPTSSWNGTAFTLDTKVNTYEIYYTNANVSFAINDTLVHTCNASATTWTNTTNLPVRVENSNVSAKAEALTMEVRSATIYRLGPLETQKTSKYISGITAGTILKLGAGNLWGVNIGAVSNTANLTIYDNTSASGTIMYSTGSMGSITTPFSISFFGAPFFTGLTAVIATASCNATVVYE